MATEVNASKLVGLIKKGKTLPEAANEMGQPVAIIGPHYYRAEVEANPKLKFKATPTSVVRAHDVEGLRWDRIAARTGLSVSAVKEMYSEKGDLKNAYTGRGRKGGSTPAAGRGSSSRKTAAASRKTGTARKGGAGGSKKKTAASRKTGAVQRNRTRAARQGSSNPS